MAINNQSVTCKLFLGFGGSGAKTLLELARMFAADQEWASRCETEAYFLLADTDAADLDHYQRQIRTTFAQVGVNAWVNSVQLSQGVARMDRLITDRLASARSDARAMQRIKSVWWFDKEDNPFIARNSQLSPSEGAGQCPAISHFLAWNAIGGESSPIGKMVDDLCGQMKGRIRDHKGARDFNVKLYMVAGLAGGTGRGSWSTLSFKIQEALQARGKVTFPIGVFFDQSCFSDVAEGTQGQRVKLVINSLTGISEVSGWLENDLGRAVGSSGGAGRYLFQLPSFASPEDAQSDVIDASRLLGTADHAGATPVRQAFLIFSEGRAGQLVAGSHYKVAAASLYGRTAQSAIESVQSNTRLNIGSLGASSIRVNVDAIRDFLGKRVEYDLIHRFATADSESDGDGAARAQTIAATILAPLMVESGRGSGGEAVDDQAGRGEPQLLARLNKMILSKVGGRIRNFVKEDLEDLDAQSYRESVKRLATAPFNSEQFAVAVREVLKESIEHVFRADFASALDVNDEAFLVKYVRSAMRNKVPSLDAEGSADGTIDHVRSFALAQLVLDTLAQQCGEIDRRFEALRPGAGHEDVVQGIEKRSGKTMLVVGRRFTEDEQGAIRDLLTSYVLDAGRGAVRALLSQWVEAMRRAADSWKDNLEDAKERALRHARALQAQVDEERADDLFTVERDFQRIESQIPTYRDYDPEAFLQPLATDADLAKWRAEIQEDEDRLATALDGITNLVLEHAYSIEGGAKPDDEKRRRLRRELGERLKAFGSHVVVPPKFLHRHFRLGDVAERLVHAWAQRIEEAASNTQKQQILKNYVKRTFGIELKVRGSECEVPSKRDIVSQMAVRLGENCGAQFMRRAESGAMRTQVDTLVFLPTDGGLVSSQTNANEWRKDLEALAENSGSTHLHFEVECEADPDDVDNTEGRRGNPFLMLAAVTEEMSVADDSSAPSEGGAVHRVFDQISSLDYWKAANDPHVKTFLDWVEDPHGKSMFADVSYSFGLGYTLPAFVTDERLRKARWCPWGRSAEERLERESSAVADAILYGLLGLKGAKSPLFQLSVANADGERTAWTLPLIRFGATKDRKNAFEFTRQAFTRETGEWRAKGRAFAAGDAVPSVKKLFDRLGADTDALRSIAEEAKYFFGELAFEEGLRDRDVEVEFVALHDWVEEKLRPDLSKLPNYDMDYSSLVDQLRERALALSKLGRSDLAEHYGR